MYFFSTWNSPEQHRLWRVSVCTCVWEGRGKERMWNIFLRFVPSVILGEKNNSRVEKFCLLSPAPWMYFVVSPRRMNEARAKLCHTLFLSPHQEIATNLTKKWFHIIHLFKPEFGVKRFPKLSNFICKEGTQEGHTHLSLFNIWDVPLGTKNWFYFQVADNTKIRNKD